MNSRSAFSVIGIFDSAQALVHAIPRLKDKLNARLEAYTPYPVEGVDKLLGLRKSPIGGMVLVMGVIGALSALGFELWTSGVDYPQVTAGKPVFSWEAFVPIMFELTVLFATFTAGLGMLLLLNRLPRFRHPMLQSRSMKLVTRDKFALAFEAQKGAELDVQSASMLLQAAGAKTIETVEMPPAPGPASARFFANTVAAIILSCVLAGSFMYWGTKLFPVTVPMVHILDQPRLNPQRDDSFFKDGFGMRMPVTETVPRGSIPYAIKRPEYAADLVNPLPRSETVLNRGRQIYTNNCGVCHGVLGNGITSLTAAYGAKPANLVSQQIVDLPDGRVYHAIMTGKNAMPSYAADIVESDRWAAVHYVRVLQRALNAKDEDIQ